MHDHRNLCVRKLKHAANSVMIFLCITLATASPSGAVMGAPQDRFSIADQQTVDKLKSVSRAKALIGPESKIFSAEIYAVGEASSDVESAKRFLALRIEDGSCSSSCPTAIFKDEIDSHSFQGLMFATRFFTYYDVIQRHCVKCGNSVAVLFFEGKEVVNTIFIHDTGIIF